MPDNVAGTAKTPEANHLFMINQECEKHSERTATTHCGQIIAQGEYILTTLYTKTIKA